MGGINSTLVALGYALHSIKKSDEKNSEKIEVLSLRPCKKGEVVGARRVYDSAFLLTPSSSLKKGPLPESQLAGKGYKTYVVCLKDPWPMVLDSVEQLVDNKELIVGDAFCAASPQPNECYPSFLAMAALGKRHGELVIAYPGKPPADPACVAERLSKAKECFLGVKYVSEEEWTKFKRLVDYVYAKNPLGSIKSLYLAMESSAGPFYRFQYPCYYEKQEDCKALRRKGPSKFKRPKRPCVGDIVDVLAELLVESR